MTGQLISQLEDFRQQVDDFLEHHPQSPMDWPDRQAFKGLDYYEPNPELVLDVEVTRYAEDEPLIEMTTNTGEQRPYRRWGSFSFIVDGIESELTLYSDAHGHEFFLPFRDATNGAETYGAGRYLDNHRPGLTRLSGDFFEIDFNYAYNPYCAYNLAYSCPLPPRENWLNVPVRAGEKKFK